MKILRFKFGTYVLGLCTRIQIDFVVVSTSSLAKLNYFYKVTKVKYSFAINLDWKKDSSGCYLNFCY